MNNSKVRIERFIKDENDPSFSVKDLSLIRFTNRGTTRVWLDEDEVLEPGESFIEADETGQGITHTYSIKFLPNPNPPNEDMPVIYSGNRLHIRALNRTQAI